MTSIEHLLPHSGPMLLLDGVLDSTEGGLVAVTTIESSSTFFRAADDSLMHGCAGVPSWVGVEYMAQAVAAWAGTREEEPGDSTKVGFLLAVREYTAHRPVFPLGSRLEVRVNALEKHGPMGIFQGKILVGRETFAEGSLSVYEGEPPTRGD